MIKCLTQGHNAVPLVSLKLATPRPRVEHSTTEPPPSSKYRAKKLGSYSLFWDFFAQFSIRKWQQWLIFSPKLGLGKSLHYQGLQIRVHIGKLFSFFLIQNISCVYSKEPSQSDSSFEHPKHMIKLIGKKIIAILR